MPYVDADEAAEAFQFELWKALELLIHALRRVAAGEPDSATIALVAPLATGPVVLAVQNRPEMVP